jgi:prepilin-type N-terminal cleavage/methylation domain-containing protein/prepilin-type processing-associated H-X9-DG protein
LFQKKRSIAMTVECPAHKQQHTQGFTLIELLVVIAIIALLMGVLMPALRAARRQAYGVVCESHLKQFGMAWYLYARDNDNYNPWYGGDWANGDFWFFKLGPYLGDKKFSTGQGDTKKGALKIMRCPSARSWTNKFGDPHAYGGADMCWKWGTTSDGKPVEGAYTLNGWMQHRPDDTSSFVFQKYVQAEPKTPLVFDGGWVDTWPTREHANELHKLADLQGSGIPGTGYRMHPNQFTRFVLARHGRAINIVFQDTHVERIPLEELGRYEWHKGFKKVQKLDLPSK